MATVDTSTAIQNLSPNEIDKLNSLQAKKQELQRKINSLVAAQPQGSPPNPEIRSLENQIATIQKEQDDLLSKGSKPPGEPLINQQGANVGEPVSIPTNIRQADASAGGTAVEGFDVSASRIDETDAIPVRRAGPREQPLPLPNQLHNYPSYTYGISLHLLTNQEYNDVVRDQKYIPERVLIASAGRYDANTFPRGERFAEDFYFDDLEIETVIGLNATSRNTNAIKIAFTIIEPYGFSLMERLIDTTSDVGAENYLDMPYLLEIDFFAHNDAGEIVGKLSDITKRIPIKLAAIDIKASLRGSEYAVQAYPFNHSAYDMTTVSGPKEIEVVAGSISDFFASNPVEINLTKDTDNATREVPTSPFGTSTLAVQPAPNFNQTNETLKYNQRNSTISSYPGALNHFYKDLKDKNQTATMDRFYFEFDQEILKLGEFTTLMKKLADPAYSRMVDKDKTNPIRISNIPRGAISDDYDPNKSKFSINAGTTIEKVINYVMNMSDYVQKQLVAPEDYLIVDEYTAALNAKKNEPLNWYKIVPTVRLGDWDSKKRVWQRDITYHVQTYTVKNVKLDTAPQLTADSPVKKYEYLYSGKNNDIIDWELNFNALYYNAMTVYKNAMSVIGNLGERRKEEESKVKANEDNIKKSKTNDPNVVMPMTYRPTVSQSQAIAGSGAQTVRQMAVADLEESLMTMSGADMLQVKLKIIGDPAFIKQDDIFYPPAAFEKITEVGQSGDQRLTPNQSIRTDYGEVYVQLMFKHPKDIDENTGTMLFNDRSKTSVFSGLYKLLTVTSNFSQGAFTQTLHLVRLPNQTEFDYTSPKATTSEERTTEADTGLVDNLIDSGGDPTPPPVGEPDEGSKAGTLPAEEADPPIDPNQEELANINDTAPTQTITATTEPQAVAPPPQGLPSRESRQTLLLNAGQEASRANDAYVDAIRSGASQEERARLLELAKAATRKVGEISDENVRLRDEGLI